MSPKILASLLILFSVLITACGPNRDESIKKIQDLEGKLMKDSVKAKDDVSAYNLQVAYLDFVDKFPKDAEAPEYLFKSANLDMSLNQGPKAMKNLDRFLTDYADSKRAPEALFYKGYVYDNLMNDDARAGEVYREFLKKYPTHEFALSAEASIRNLGKTNEELIREFEQMNSDSSSVKGDSLKGKS